MPVANSGAGRDTAWKDAEETVMQKLNSERGMSLVEATIILMTLAILTSVLAPSIGDYVNDARQVKAKEDIEALGTGIYRLLRDTGKPFPQRTVNTTYTAANRVDLLVSDGNIPSSTDMGTAAEATAGNYLVSATMDIDDAGGTNNQVEFLTDHLVDNDAAYAQITFPVAGGPRSGIGWRGGYISTATGPDPWGNRYHCVTVWLNPSSDTTGAGKGSNKDSFCATAGADGTVDTDIDGSSGGVVVAADDAIYVFQGATR